MDSWVIWAVIGVIVFGLIFIYNRLVALKQRRNNAFSDIDVQLKQRYDLVPNLVETVKGYAEHEDQVFTKVTNARAAVGAARGGVNPDAGRIDAEQLLGGALVDLFAVAEAYPDLKADANFRQLQAELSDIENKIAAARRFFNSATAELNAAVQQFPAVLFAESFGFTQESFFELDPSTKDAVQTPPDVNFN